MEKQPAVRFWLSCGLMTLMLLAPLTSPSVSAAEGDLRPVFIRATTCDGKISSAVLSGLREDIGRSQKYRLTRGLSDEGKMDVVLTINIDCAERDNIAAVATVYGQAKCFGAKNCHHTVDGSSIRSGLCDSNAAAECGRALFKAFDLYMTNPFGPPLKLQ